jgi:hypothetical protein
MTTQYTPILKLALPVQGELSGTWGDVVNDNITSMVEQAIAGLSVVNTWTTNSHTLTTANGTTAESRAAMLSLTDSGTALTGAGSVICPALSKVYIVKNGTAQVITVKTAAGSGIAVPVGKTMLVYCDGTNVLEAVDHVVTLSAGTLTVTGVATLASLVATTADINAGTIDGTVIGGTTAAAISGTTGQFGTSLNVDGTVTADGLTVQTTNGLNAVLESANSYQHLQFKNSGYTENYIDFTNRDFNITCDNVNRFTINGTNGDVGIGTSSPNGRLEAVGGTGGGFTGWFRTGDATAANNAGGGFYSTSSATAASRSALLALDADGANLSGGDYFVIQKNGNSGSTDIVQYSNAAMRFGTDYLNRSTYDMTLDASGNLLAGKSATAFGTAGIEASASNGLWSTRSGLPALALNRLSTDGSIADFYKDGTVVGSTGANNGTIYFAGPNANAGGFRIDSSGSDGVIIPTTNTGANRDAAVDLGYSSGGTNIRFKDLYLSGGVYLGGTGAANLLNDYEEGTWTPVLSKSTTAPSVTYTAQLGAYTKVGRLVFVSGRLAWSAISGGTGEFRIEDLPFTILNSTSAYSQMTSIDYGGVTFGANDTTFGGYGAINGTYIVLIASKNNATDSTSISGLETSGFMYFNLTYQAA